MVRYLLSRVGWSSWFIINTAAVFYLNLAGFYFKSCVDLLLLLETNLLSVKSKLVRCIILYNAVGFVFIISFVVFYSG